MPLCCNLDFAAVFKMTTGIYLPVPAAPVNKKTQDQQSLHRNVCRAQAEQESVITAFMRHQHRLAKI